MAFNKSNATLFSTTVLVLVLLVVQTESKRRNKFFDSLAIRNAHPEDKLPFTPPTQNGNAEQLVGMEQTVPEQLPTSQRQVSNQLFFGTELNDFLKELERYVAIAGRPRFGRSTETQMKEELQSKVDIKATPAAKENKPLPSLPELQISIRICHGNKVCLFTRVIKHDNGQ